MSDGPTTSTAAGEETRLPPRSDSTEELTDIEERDDRPFFFRYVTPFVKIWGVLTIAGIWICTVFLIKATDLPEADTFVRWYWLAISIAVSLIEMIWYINKCAICRDDGGCCCTCWRLLMFIDNWKKGFLYAVAAIPGFLHLVMLSVIAGVLLIVFGMLYIIKSFSDCQCVGGKKYVRHTKRDAAAAAAASKASPPLHPAPADDRDSESQAICHASPPP